MSFFVNSLMTHVGDLLRTDPPLSGTTVEVGMPLNLDQGKLPWIDVLPGEMTAEGRQIAAGLPIGWDALVQIQVYHQSYSEVSSGSAPLDLMATQAKIITAVSSNTQLDGTALILRSIQGAIFEADPDKEVFLTNLITLTYDVRGS